MTPRSMAGIGMGKDGEKMQLAIRVKWLSTTRTRLGDAAVWTVIF